MQDPTDKKVITDDLEIIDFFRTLFKSKERLWLWQQDKKAQTGRTVHFCQVRKVDVLKKTIQLASLTEQGFSFGSKETELFLYARDKNMAVKFMARELETEYILLNLPSKVNYMNEDLAKKINLVEKEDDEDKKDLREQPRKPLKERQTAQLSKNEGSKIFKFDLYDVSAGGVALKSPDPGAFQKGDQIKIFSINGKKLPKELKGSVISVRHITNDDLFKVGVQFID